MYVRNKWINIIESTYHFSDTLCLGYTLLQHHHLLIFRLVEGELFANQLLYPLVQLHVILTDEGDSLARSAGTSRPTNSVDVIFTVRRDVKVDYNIHVWYI